MDLYALYFAEFLFKNAQVSVYSLSYLNIGNCVGLTFGGQAGGFFVERSQNIVINIKQFSSELNLLSLSKCNKF